MSYTPLLYFSPCTVVSLPSERRANHSDLNFQLCILITVIIWPLLSQLVAGAWVEPSYKTVDLKDTDNPMLQHETASSYKFSFNKTLASNRNNNRERLRERLQGYFYHFHRHFIKRWEKRQNVPTRAGKIQSRVHEIRRTRAPKINSRCFHCVDVLRVSLEFHPNSLFIRSTYRFPEPLKSRFSGEKHF